MALDDYTSSEESSGQTKTTYFQYENPEHPESKDHDDPEKAQRHFEAARYIQRRLGPDRHNLVGEFLYAVKEAEENDNEEPLQELVADIRE